MRTTKKGQQRGGKLFTKTNLHHLLTNVSYIGKVKHKADTHEGEHAAILDATTWQKACALETATDEAAVPWSATSSGRF
ncbi:MAG: recombinase family protein [Gemmataceae bacterium]